MIWVLETEQAHAELLTAITILYEVDVSLWGNIRRSEERIYRPRLDFMWHEGSVHYVFFKLHSSVALLTNSLGQLLGNGNA